jgi:hypothetical protein
MKARSKQPIDEFKTTTKNTLKNKHKTMQKQQPPPCNTGEEQPVQRS